MAGGILFYGDPHSNVRNLFRAAEDLRGKFGGIVLVGDMNFRLPLKEELSPLFRMEPKVKIRWIHGNHDSDHPQDFTRTHGNAPELNLSGRFEQLGTTLVAGLGGVFKEKIWYPDFDAEAAALWDSPKAWMKAHKDRYDGGLPLSQRDTIWPSNIRELAKFHVDVLVTHTPPAPHKYGFEALSKLAKDMRAGLVVHGHVHDSYLGKTPDGITVKGLGQAEPWLYEPGVM